MSLLNQHFRSIVLHVKMRLGALRRGLTDHNLRLLQLTSLAHNTVEYAVIVALSVFAFDRGGAAAVGVITVVRTAPALLSGPLLAVITDRYSRSTILALGFAGRGVTTLALAVAISSDPASVLVYGLAALDAIVASVFYPAYGALVPELARQPDELATANALSSAAENLGTIIGPLVAAGILVLSGPSVVFVVSAIVVVGAAVVATRLRSDRVSLAERGVAATFLRDFANGMAAVRRNRGSGLVVGAWAFESVLVGMSEVLLVVIAFDLIDWGDAGVGVLNAVLGFGGLAGSIAMASMARNRPFGKYLAAGVILFGLSLAANGAAPVVFVVLLAHWSMGIAGAQVDIAAMTLLQRTVPDDELGRVFGAFEGIYWGALGLGAAMASWTVVAIGLRPALIGLGVLAAVIGLILLPLLLQVDTLVDVPESRLGLLRAIPIFAALPVPTVERLARRMSATHVAAGTVIIREGETGDALFVVDKGELTVELEGQTVAQLQAGDVVGEMAPALHSTRTATVRALTDVDLLQLDGTAFIETVTGHTTAREEVDTLVNHRIGQLRRIRARTGR